MNQNAIISPYITIREKHIRMKRSKEGGYLQKYVRVSVDTERRWREDTGRNGTRTEAYNKRNVERDWGIENFMRRTFILDPYPCHVDSHVPRAWGSSHLPH